MYKLIQNGVIRLTDEIFIPNNPANKDFQEYQKWLKQGNKPIPEDIPIECIDKQTFQIDNECVFLKLKENLLNQLNRITTQYIERNYPPIKQKSDIADKDYYENYIRMKNIDEIQFRQLLAQSVLAIYDSNSDFNTELNNIYSALNISEDDTTLKFAIEQLLKVAVRIEFVQRVKAIYRSIKKKIENATTIDELNSIELTNIQFPELPTLS